MRITLLSLGVVLGCCSWASAAIPKAQVNPSRILIGNSSTQGGKSGQALALMDVRHSASKSGKMERVVLDFGSSDLKDAKGLVGYYHAELQQNPARLVLELPQTYASRLPEKEILKRLQKSNYVRSAQVGFDRNLQSLTMVFQLKQPVQARVARVTNPESTGKIVIDFAPDTPQARAALARRQQQQASRLRAAPEPGVRAAASRTAPGVGSRQRAPATAPANRIAAPAAQTTAAPAARTRTATPGAKATVVPAARKATADRAAASLREAPARQAPALKTAPVSNGFFDSAPVAPAKALPPKKNARQPEGLTDADRAAAESVLSPKANR
ncbi:MAG: hypothetical protein KF767_02645 [Bdellovibrionaceae bacterium]|nr:hypothetical protein [Pseudobdellovibrionaceae bacterium]